MSDHFNELLLQTLKEVGVRLERLEGRTDHIINEKADKIDVSEVKSELKNLRTEFKADINGVRIELNDVRTELKADVNSVKSELNDVRTELKADVNSVKSELNDVRTELKADVNSVKSELNEIRDELRSQGQRINRIETGIRTLQWTMTAGLAVLGIILAFIKAF